MEKAIAVYITAMQDALRNKYKILNEILEATKKQEELVTAEEMDMDVFDELLDRKDKLLFRMQELDQGFQTSYERIKDELEKEKQLYKPRILEMQNMLRQITDLGVKIQALEQRNKARFEGHILKKKQEIQDFRVNNKTASAYNQHMANQHHEWQSYFLDKKK